MMDRQKVQKLQKVAFEMEEALHFAQKFVKNPLAKEMMRKAQLEYLEWEKDELDRQATEEKSKSSGNTSKLEDGDKGTRS